jgi:glycosyltransferase involved in cell wall biosynthesis
VTRRLSIVTPCLNAEATLRQTLASVAEQSTGLDVEHIVVDGGSTDGTVDLLRESLGVRWISEPDRGLSDAMNKGVAMATGDVVGWLNADDLYLSGALGRVAVAFDDRPSARWLTGGCIIIDAQGQEIRRGVTAYKRRLLRHYSLPLFLTQNFVASPATFVRRSAYAEVGPFEERFRYSMDYDVWLRLARLEAPIILGDPPLAAFRMAEGSLSMSGFERQFMEHAQNAREHGEGHPVAVAVNALTSCGIVLAYRLMRGLRAHTAER